MLKSARLSLFMVLHIIEIIAKDDLRSRNLEMGNSKWYKKKKENGNGKASRSEFEINIYS